MGTAGAKVIVASKLPMALELQYSELHDVTRRLRETVWTEKEARKIGPIYRINGTAYPANGTQLEGFRAPPQMVHGYALTYGVDAEWWAKWVAVNKDTPFVVSELLFAGKTRDEVSKRAKDLHALTSGFDPVAPPKNGPVTDPRLPQPIKGLTLEGTPGPTDAEVAA